MTAASAATLALRILNLPVFMLRPDQHVLHMNPAAEDLLKVAGLVHVLKGGAVWRRAQDARLIGEAIADIEMHRRPRLVCLSTRAGLPGYLVLLRPIPDVTTIMVCVVDLNAPLSLPAGWSSAAFGFNEQNAELAESIAAGHTLNEFCATSGISLGAPKTRMKKILLATGAHSQSSLAIILLRATAVFPLFYDQIKIIDAL